MRIILLLQFILIFVFYYIPMQIRTGSLVLLRPVDGAVHFPELIIDQKR